MTNKFIPIIPFSFFFIIVLLTFISIFVQAVIYSVIDDLEVVDTLTCTVSEDTKTDGVIDLKFNLMCGSEKVNTNIKFRSEFFYNYAISDKTVPTVECNHLVGMIKYVDRWECNIIGVPYDK